MRGFVAQDFGEEFFPTRVAQERGQSDFVLCREVSPERTEHALAESDLQPLFESRDTPELGPGPELLKA